MGQESAVDGPRRRICSPADSSPTDSQVAKLTKQYGKEDVDKFLDGMTVAVKDSLKRATEVGVTLPTAPADLKGKKR